MKTTISDHEKLLTKRGALLAPALVFALLVGAPGHSEAKALASAVLNITNLVWYRDVNGDTVVDTDLNGNQTISGNSDDVPVVTGLSSGNNITVRAEDDDSSLDVDNGSGVSDAASDTRNWTETQAGQSLRAGPVCAGADCPTYTPSQEFTADADIDNVTGAYAFASELLENATFGFHIGTSGEDATLGLRSEVGRTENPSEFGSATASVSSSEVLFPPTARNIQVLSSMRTYFAATYSRMLLAELGADEADAGGGFAEASINFAIELTGISPITATPAGLSGLVSADSSTPVDPVTGTKRLYTTDSGTSWSNPFTLTAGNIWWRFNASTSAIAASDPAPVPVPGTLLLVFLGLALGVYLRASHRPALIQGTAFLA